VVRQLAQRRALLQELDDAAQLFAKGRMSGGVDRRRAGERLARPVQPWTFEKLFEVRAEGLVAGLRCERFIDEQQGFTEQVGEPCRAARRHFLSNGADMRFENICSPLDMFL